MSFAATAVVQPVRVVDRMAVPLEMDGVAEAVIELAAVGTDVPDAIFQTSTVAVPASTVMVQAEIVQAKGTP
jgi:hypothetical protein